MLSTRIRDLAVVFLTLRGVSKDFYEITGIRAGEKMHEGLLFEEETGFLMSNEEMFIRLPLRFDFDKGMKRLEKWVLKGQLRTSSHLKKIGIF